MKCITISEVNKLLREKKLEDNPESAAAAIGAYAMIEKGMRFTKQDAIRLYNMWEALHG